MLKLISHQNHICSLSEDREQYQQSA